MYSTIRRFARLATFAGLVLLACGGTAVAAKLITGAAVKDGSLTGRDVKDRTILARDLAPSVVAETRGTRGEPGPPGPRGETGPMGPVGPAGPINGVLPSGVTLRGFVNIGGRATDPHDAFYESVSFPLSLPSTPQVEMVIGKPSANCPGHAGAPEAKPGFACVYVGSAHNAALAVIGGGVPDGARRFGIPLVAQSEAAGSLTLVATWAVTAP
ncbi:MAG TPA: hypothetical protein VF504_01915 [Solirubrobacterales bacterium]|jgi:hypothetical protein